MTGEPKKDRQNLTKMFLQYCSKKCCKKCLKK
jgi:hypothetical protein